MAEIFDAIVLGVGGMGSATLMQLAQRGLSVLGLERFGVAHDRGSSHGESRIIRKAYFEHPDYVPLLQRSYELWRELEQLQSVSLYEECGLFLCGPTDGEVLSGARQSAQQHQLKLDDVPLTDARERFGLFRFAEDDAVVFEHEAGWLRVEAAVAAYHKAAIEAGAECRFETVTGWYGEQGHVSVVTENASYLASRLVITAGAWSAGLLGQLAPPLTVLRKMQLWYPADDPAWSASPGFFFERPDGCFYGFPAQTNSQTGDLELKIAEHTGGTAIDDPATIDRELHLDDRRPVDEFVVTTLRQVSAKPVRHAACLYTMTPDGHFLVDRHPESPQVVFAAGFSGHGFKFVPVIGEALADLVVDGDTDLPIEFLGLNRPALQSR